MERDRIAKRNFSLAISLVLVAAMFSYMLSPTTTGAYSYPERAALTADRQPSEVPYYEEYYPSKDESLERCRCDVGPGDGNCPDGYSLFLLYVDDRGTTDNCADMSRAVCSLGTTCYVEAVCRRLTSPFDSLEPQTIWSTCVWGPSPFE